MDWKQFEKSWVKSKKFLAFLLMEILLSLLLIYMVYCQKGVTFSWPHALVFLGFVFNMGFIAVSFNLEQAKLDKYTRFAAIFRGTGSPTELLDAQLKDILLGGKK